MHSAFSIFHHYLFFGSKRVTGLGRLFGATAFLVSGIYYPILGEKNFSQVEQAIGEILYSHPEIRALEEGVKSSYWDQQTKNQVPDPKIGFAYRSYPARSGSPFKPDLKNREDLPGMSGREISISQEIPYPEKLDSEKKIAKWSYREEEEKTRIQKNTFLKSLYALLLEKKFINEELREWGRIQTILHSLGKISNAGFVSGRENTFSTLRDNNDHTKVQDKIIELETKRDEVDRALEYFLSDAAYHSNVTEPTQVGKTSPNGQSSPGPSILESMIQPYLDHRLDNLIDRIQSKADIYARNNPESKLYQAQVQKTQESENRDLLEFFPDTEVFLAYMQRNPRLVRISQNPLNWGEIMPTEEFTGDLVSFGVTLKVPVWSWAWRGDIRRKNQYARNQAQYSQEAIEKKIKSEIRRITKTLQGNLRRIEYYEKDLIPTLEKSARIKTASSSAVTGDASSVLRLKLEYQMAKAERIALDRTKYATLLDLLELTDEISPIQSLTRNTR